MKILLVLWMIISCNIIFAQNNFYFKRIYTEADEYPTFLLDCENDQLFLSTYYDIDYRVPTIFKFKKNRLVDSLQIIDYNGTIFYLGAKDSKTFTAWGFTSDNNSNNLNLTYWLIDTSLHILENKNYLTKFNEHIYVHCNHLNNGNYIITTSGIGNLQHGILFLKLDSNVNLIDSVYIDYLGYDLAFRILKYDNFYIAPIYSSHLTMSFGTARCFVRLDSSLNIIRIDTIPPRQSGIAFSMNIKKKNEKEFYLSGKSEKIIGGSVYHRSTVSIFDTSYHVLKTVHFGNSTPDTSNYPASYTNFDFKNLNNLYFNYTYNFPFDFPWSSQKTWIVVCNLDSNLNLKWRKFVGGDLSYNSNSLLASPDGGCYVTGTIYDSTLNIYQRDIFILKFDSLGNVISNVPENTYVFDNTLVYPNPGTNELNVLLPENNKNTTLELVNSLGIVCKEEQFTNDKL
ncbi:MAG: hypothetical protein HPY79_12490, partial [Bacteroidales bacterium]|nr:hypothetical protein [Bacteroidales bacterium]